MWMCNAGWQLSLFGASAWSPEFTVWVACPQRRDSHRTGAALGRLMLPRSSKDNVSASLPGSSSSPYASFFGGISPKRTPPPFPLPPSTANGFQIQSASLSFPPELWDHISFSFIILPFAIYKSSRC